MRKDKVRCCSKSRQDFLSEVSECNLVWHLRPSVGFTGVPDVIEEDRVRECEVVLGTHPGPNLVVLSHQDGAIPMRLKEAWECPEGGELGLEVTINRFVLDQSSTQQCRISEP